MNMLKFVTIGFLLLEAANVLILYFNPGSKYANGVGVFNAWEKSKRDPEVHKFVVYLVNWVAGTKLIFILLLVVILYTATDQSLLWMGIAMTVSIVSFFWRLFPLIRSMDRENQIDPRNYSMVLAGMIMAVIALFLIGTLLAI